MAKLCKRLTEAHNKIEKGRQYTLKEGISLFKETATAKFDETMEIHIRPDMRTSKSAAQWCFPTVPARPRESWSLPWGRR